MILLVFLFYFFQTHGTTVLSHSGSTGFCCNRCQWRRSVINLGGLGHLSPSAKLRQSSFLPFPLVDSPGGLGPLGRDRSPAAKHFDAIYTVKQPNKINIDV